MSVARVLAAEAVESHVREFFKGHSVEVVEYDLGPGRREVLADLRVLVVGAGPRSDCWAYVTASDPGLGRRRTAAVLSSS